MENQSLLSYDFKPDWASEEQYDTVVLLQLEQWLNYHLNYQFDMA